MTSAPIREDSSTIRQRPPARHDSLAGQSAFAARGSAHALPSVLRCARPPNRRAFGAAAVRQVSRARRPPPSFPTDAFGSRKRRSSAAALHKTLFKNVRNHRRPRASGTGRFSKPLPKHIKTQRLRSGGRVPPIPHQLALPAQTFPRRRDKRCRRHGMVSPLSSPPQRRGCSPRCVETDACSPCCFMPLGIPRKNSPARKTPPRSPPLATAADRRTSFGALPHFDKTPRSAARGPAVTPAVAAPSFRSDLAPESAAGRIVQP